MRPTLRLLDDGLIERILSEARDLLGSLGVEIHNPSVLELLGAHGARVEKQTARAFFDAAIVDRALASAPREFRLYDVLGASYDEIAELTGVPEGTVKSRIYRGRKELALALGTSTGYQESNGQ